MRLRNQLFWIAAISGLLLDQLTKRWVVKTFELTTPPESTALWPGVFHFTYVTNTGAAFSLFSNNGEWLRWLSLLVSLVLILVGLLVPFVNRWEKAGYGLILSGALGNGIDRFFNGEVVDFLDAQFFDIPMLFFRGGAIEFQWLDFPIFNVADVCINVGIVCLLIAALRDSSPQNGNGSSQTQKR